MLRNAAGKRGVRRLLLSVGVGLLTFAAAALLSAWLLEKGILPMTMAQTLSVVSLALGASAAGLCQREGGRSGMRSGAALLACFLLWKGIVSPGPFWTASTAIEAAICVLLPWMISCIFHKSTKANTKRYRKKRA